MAAPRPTTKHGQTPFLQALCKAPPWDTRKNGTKMCECDGCALGGGGRCSDERCDQYGIDKGRKCARLVPYLATHTHPHNLYSNKFHCATVDENLDVPECDPPGPHTLFACVYLSSCASILFKEVIERHSDSEFWGGTI